MKADLVLVEWIDAHAEAAWYSVSDVLEDHKAAIALNVGWLLKRDKAGISLFVSYFASDGTIGQVNFIPAEMVRKVTVLKKAKRG